MIHGLRLIRRIVDENLHEYQRSIPAPIYAARWLCGGALISPTGKLSDSIGDFNSL
jgi:hypothetical protein